MTPRPPVDRERVLTFLKALGDRFHGSGRVYLVGGATLIWEGLRTQTIDIDIALEVASSEHQALIDVIRRLKEEMQVNVEEAGPADFIPLPEGWRERCLFLDRFGRLDVFHFDLYSVSLSKIARGLESDFEDVLALLKTGRVDFAELERHYRSILPRFGRESLKQDPADFTSKFRALASRRL